MKKVKFNNTEVSIDILLNVKLLAHYNGGLNKIYIDNERFTLRKYLNDEKVFEEFTKKLSKDYIKRGRRPKIFNQQQINEIYQLKDTGLSNVKIAKMFDVSEKTIRNYLKLRNK